MLEELKKIVKQTEDANVPARFLFGEVKKLSPLTVLVDNRFYLSPPALVSHLFLELRDGVEPADR